jgi:hypothetical protein
LGLAAPKGQTDDVVGAQGTYLEPSTFFPLVTSDALHAEAEVCAEGLTGELVSAHWGQAADLAQGVAQSSALGPEAHIDTGEPRLALTEWTIAFAAKLSLLSVAYRSAAAAVADCKAALPLKAPCVCGGVTPAQAKSKVIVDLERTDRSGVGTGRVRVVLEVVAEAKAQAVLILLEADAGVLPVALGLKGVTRLILEGALVLWGGPAPPVYAQFARRTGAVHAAVTDAALVHLAVAVVVNAVADLLSVGVYPRVLVVAVAAVAQVAAGDRVVVTDLNGALRVSKAIAVGVLVEGPCALVHLSIAVVVEEVCAVLAGPGEDRGVVVVAVDLPVAVGACPETVAIPVLAADPPHAPPALTVGAARALLREKPVAGGIANADGEVCGAVAFPGNTDSWRRVRRHIGTYIWRRWIAVSAYIARWREIGVRVCPPHIAPGHSPAVAGITCERGTGDTLLSYADQPRITLGGVATIAALHHLVLPVLKAPSHQEKAHRTGYREANFHRYSQ